ncbi:MAG: hypothetical protein JNL28_08130 [Planctomycetes bacterium]|nr:hypothetical protein [Planctomycetota bacterium]
MISKLLLSMATVACFATVARAGADSPSSLLLFPEYNSAPGVFTVISVANTKNGPQGLPTAPAVRAHFVYIDGATCQETDRFEPLTPNDLVTVIAGFHNSTSAKGFLYVYAVDAATGAAIKWDWLIGSQMQLDGITTFNYSYNPIGFKAAVGGGDGTPTDVDGDGGRDLNGVEYEKAWNEILIPHFFGQGNGRRSELVLINLSGRFEFLATANFLVYDDYENVYSAQYQWRCWTKVPLSKTAPHGNPATGINDLFNNTFLAANGGQGALQGAAGVETGWMRIRGATASSTAAQVLNPAIIAVLDETIGTFGMGDIPYFVDQTNVKGDLLAPAGPFGDQTGG